MKVWNASRTRSVTLPRIQSVSALCSRVRAEFGIPDEIRVDLVLEEDGTVVDDDDYLDCLDEAVEIVVIPPWERYSSWRQRLESVLKNPANRDELLRSARKFFADEAEQKSEVVANYVSKLPRNRDFSSRDDDPSWFEGVNPRFKTKEKVMRDRAQSRMRNYLRDSKQFLLESSSRQGIKALAEHIVASFERQLKAQDYHGHFFDRSERNEPSRFCDDEGSFKCQGTFNRSSCDYTDHEINPYDNRESLIVFQNWNLDHGVEKARTVLPGLRDAINDVLTKRSSSLRVNENYFFELLFTAANLKLVHTVCHVKTGHKCRQLDEKRIFVTSPVNGKILRKNVSS